MLSRGRFGTGAIVAALVRTRAADAAQPADGAGVGRKRRVDVMLPVSRNDHFLVVLQDGFREAGWGENDIEFEIRRANGSAEQFRTFAQKFAAMAEHKVPAIYGIAEMVRSGGLVSYGQDLGDHWRLSATYIDRILHGAKPADLPAQFSTNYALAINRRAAKALNLVVPPAMLSRAGEVVE